MKTYRIKQIAKMTGLSKEVLRVWEKRYQLVSPLRGPNRYRLYTEEDLNILKYLVKEIELGQSIGELATLGKDEILARISSEKTGTSEKENHTKDPLIEDLENSLIPLDQHTFEEKFKNMSALMPFEEFFNRVMIPLQIRVGELWSEEKVSIAVEHYVTTQVRQKLFAVMSMLGIQKGLKVVIACPPWDLHEIGAQTVAYHCSTLGCQSILLGANLPVESLIHFCTREKPDLVILSFTTIFSENKIKEYFFEISQHLIPLCPVVVGGQVISQWESHIDNKNIKVLKTLAHLEEFLKKLTIPS